MPLLLVVPGGLCCAHRLRRPPRDGSSHASPGAAHESLGDFSVMASHVIYRQVIAASRFTARKGSRVTARPLSVAPLDSLAQLLAGKICLGLTSPDPFAQCDTRRQQAGPSTTLGRYREVEPHETAE